jgi:hypothetical protein
MLVNANAFSYADFSDIRPGQGQRRNCCPLHSRQWRACHPAESEEGFNTGDHVAI